MFKLEKDLVEKLKFHYEEFCSWDLSNSYTKVFEEVSVGYGIADLVISNISNVCNHSKPQDSLNYLDLTILNIIEQNSEVNLHELQSRTKATLTLLKKSIKRLKSNSYISENDHRYTLIRNYEKVVVETVAIEAKLKNWKRALNQAYRYKWFSERTFVVLDSKFSSPAIKNLELFKSLNVGLAEIAVSGETIVHFSPVSQTPLNNKMNLLFNELVKGSLLTY